MSTHEAYQALVIDRGTIIVNRTFSEASEAWHGLKAHAYGSTDRDTARTLQRHWDSGYSTIRLVRRFNGRELIYQVRTVSVDAKGNLVNVAL